MNKLIFITLVTLFVSCKSTVKPINKNKVLSSVKKCDSFKIISNQYNASSQNKIEAITVLPHIVDYYTKDKAIKYLTLIDSFSATYHSEINAVIKKSNLPVEKFKTNFESKKDSVNYRKAIKYYSGSIGHGHYKPKDFYPKKIALSNIGKYLITFDTNIYSYNSLKRTTIYLYLFDTEKEENTYYDSIIVEDCKFLTKDKFETLINLLLTNFKERQAI